MAEPLDPLIQAYARAYRAIQAEQDAIATNPQAFRRRERLTEMQGRITSILNDMDAQAKEVVRRELPKVYAAGVRQAAGAINAAPPSAFGQIDTKAVKVLSDDLFGDLLQRTEFVREDTKRLIRQIVRDKVLTGAIGGESPAKTRREVVKFLKDSGVGRVRYANGRMVRLDDYADMAIRTKRTLAYTEGNLNQNAKNGVKYMEVFDGPGCGWLSHEDTLQANGRVVTIDEARANPISHPNCRRSFGGRPDVRTKEQAAKAKSSVSPEQIADQIAADKARKAAQAKAAAGRRRADTLGNRKDINAKRGQRPRPVTPRAPKAQPAQTLQKPSATISNQIKTVAGKKVIDDAMTAIGKVHGLPDGVTSLPITSSRNGLGFYKNSASSPHSISIRTSDPNGGFAMLHEFGHFLDHAWIGGKGDFATKALQFSSSDDTPLGRWYAAVKDSKAVQSIQDRVLKRGEQKYKSYFLSPDELFARSYSQWVAEKSGGALADQLKSFREGWKGGAEGWSVQWEDEDFRGIAKALDALFRSLGWLT